MLSRSNTRIPSLAETERGGSCGTSAAALDRRTSLEDLRAAMFKRFAFAVNIRSSTKAPVCAWIDMDTRASVPLSKNATNWDWSVTGPLARDMEIGEHTRFRRLAVARRSQAPLCCYYTQEILDTEDRCEGELHRSTEMNGRCGRTRTYQQFAGKHDDAACDHST